MPGQLFQRPRPRGSKECAAPVGPAQELKGGAGLTRLRRPGEHHEPAGTQRGGERLLRCAEHILIPLPVGGGVTVRRRGRAERVRIKVGHPWQPALNRDVDQPSERHAAGERQRVRSRKAKRRGHGQAVRVPADGYRREPFHGRDRNRRTALPGTVLDDHSQGDVLAEHQRAGQAAPRRSFELVRDGRAAGHCGLVKPRATQHQMPGPGIPADPDRAVQPGGNALLLARRVPMLPQRETRSLAIVQFPRTAAVHPSELNRVQSSGPRSIFPDRQDCHIRRDGRQHGRPFRPIRIADHPERAGGPAGPLVHRAKPRGKDQVFSDQIPGTGLHRTAIQAGHHRHYPLSSDTAKNGLDVHRATARQSSPDLNFTLLPGITRHYPTLPGITWAIPGLTRPYPASQGKARTAKADQCPPAGLPEH